MLNSIVLFSACIVAGVFFYIKSVSPAFLEIKHSEKVYVNCAIYRQIASVFLNVNFLFYIKIKKLNFVPMLKEFPWHYSISIIIVLLTAVPGLYLFIKGRKDLGSESISPQKSKELIHVGIYKRIRHPQAAGEICFWFAWSFILNSPILVLISFIWIPVYYLMCLAEERDLLIRFGKAYSEYITDSGFFLPVK